MNGAIRANLKKVRHDKRVEQKCIKCRSWKLIDGNFGKHSSGKHQVICYSCKSIANKDARDKDLRVRLRHHTASRCLTQLGEHTPEHFTANLGGYLGYSIQQLLVHLKDELRLREDKSLKVAIMKEGYHVDHKVPLHTFKVLNEGVIDWKVFQDCWALSNLSAISAEENLTKGGKVGFDVRTQEGGEEPQTDVTEDGTTNS